MRKNILLYFFQLKYIIITNKARDLPLPRRTEGEWWIDTGYTTILIKDEPTETCYHKSTHRRFHQPIISFIKCDQHISSCFRILMTGIEESFAVRW